MVVENVGGGGGSLGVAAVARAHPDGYTLVLGGTITHINEVLLKSRPQYDAVKDLDPVAGAAANVLCIAVHPSVPAQNLKEFVAYANANPGKLSYGHAGVGSIQHLAGELFKSLAGTPDIVQVPYRGTGPLITDVLAGQVQMGTPGVTGQVIELHRSGKMRVLANWGAERIASFPELPTFRELGYKDVEFYIWAGLFAQSALPAPIMTRLREAMAQAVKSPEVTKTFETAGSPVAYMDAPEFSKFVEVDSARLVAAVKKIGKVE